MLLVAVKQRKEMVSIRKTSFPTLRSIAICHPA